MEENDYKKEMEEIEQVQERTASVLGWFIAMLVISIILHLAVADKVPLLVYLSYFISSVLLFCWVVYKIKEVKLIALLAQKRLDELTEVIGQVKK